jgi:hypothetical protein
MNVVAIREANALFPSLSGQHATKEVIAISGNRNLTRALFERRRGEAGTRERKWFGNVAMALIGPEGLWKTVEGIQPVELDQQGRYRRNAPPSLTSPGVSLTGR